MTYLRSKLVGSEDLTEASATLTKAYESAVIHVGLDVESFPLWFEYIEFTKSLPVINKIGTYLYLTPPNDIDYDVL